ncbi:MAG: hypothetical protein HY360_02080 [Verrucomicrobia bacterium]|nr:hypothetical protein [Verrucomicrobiota bacterium]
MNLIALVHSLESQLRKTEKLARRHHSEADALRRKLSRVARIVGIGDEELAVTVAPAKASSRKPRRKMSRAGRAAIIAALKKRWAAYRAEGGPQPGSKAVRKKRRVLSAAHKKAIAATQKARWAKIRAGKKG